MPTNRVNFLGLGFDSLDFREVLKLLAGRTECYRYVVTPNVDHVVRLHSQPDLMPVYEAADLCVCDSRVLRALGRLAGLKLPVVPGSDLTESLFRGVVEEGDRIAIVGGTSAVLSKLRKVFPDVDFTHHSPPMGLATNPFARRTAAEFIANADARFAFIAVGSPQGEMIAHEVMAIDGARGTALCIGASIEFITGHQKRAPKWLRVLSLEWAHRLALSPRRLWRRYLLDGMAVFPIFARWSVRQHKLKMLGGGVLVVLSTVGLYGWAFANRSTVVEAALAPAKYRASVEITLPDPGLYRPLSPEVASAVNSQRSFVQRPDDAAREFVLSGDAQSRERAGFCLAQAIYYEAGNEPVDGKRAIAQVVLNRVRHPGFPASVCGVVYQGSERQTGCQFTFTCDGSLRRPAVGRAWSEAQALARAALSGSVFAPVGHATHYHAVYVLPYWADSLDKTLRIGTHLFYRLRGVLGDKREFSERYAGAERVPSVTERATTADDPSAESLLQVLVDPGRGAEVQPEPGRQEQRLVADATAGTLILGSGSGTKTAERSREQSCGERDRQLQPLQANDLQSAANAAC